MKRVQYILVAALALMIGACGPTTATHADKAPPAPEPAAPKPTEPAFFPDAIGNMWRTRLTEYRTELGTSEAINSVVTRKVVKKAGNVVTLEKRRGDSSPQEETVTVSPDGLLLQEVGRAPFLALKLPPKDGDTWKLRYPALFEGGDLTDATAKTGPAAEIEVPAGRFRAVPVTVVVKKEIVPGIEKTERTTIHYAPQVGILKRVFESSGQPVQIEVLEMFQQAGSVHP
jgi:hypothetical protein